MRLIGLAVVLVIGLTLLPLVGEAQQAGKLYRIGNLVPGTEAAASPLIAVFRQTLTGLGYVEGQNVVMELRYSQTAESTAARPTSPNRTTSLRAASGRDAPHHRHKDYGHSRGQYRD